jgi:malonyl-CoA/methylmalonyl-CoA synthetase
MSGNLYSQFLSAMPDAAQPFVRTSSGRIISYGDVVSLSGKMANALTGLGLERGDRVAVQVEKSPEALILYLACLRVGAVYLPLNTAYTISELEYFVGDAEPKIFVVAPSKASELTPMTTRLGVAATETLGTDGASGSLIERAQNAPADFSDVPANPDDLAAILYTSGTTGRSKGAMLSHANLGSNAKTLKEIWRFTSDDVLLHALPIFHTHGLFVASNVILSAGASMIFLPKLDPDEVFRLMLDATTMMGVPTFYMRLLQDARLNRETTAHMRLFISGSAPLLEETHREWRERTGHAILERYGMTETNMNTSNPYYGDRVPGSVGFPLPGVLLRVTDPETGAQLPQGETGMLEVKGPNVFSGYWRMEGKTKAEFRADGYFITGDLVTIDERGYVSIVGRSKDLIISGGYNVYPKEVESEIDALPGVVESAVVGVAHRDFGEGVTAIVVPKKDAQLYEKDIVTSLRKKLANYKLPKRIIFIDELPRNTMGKVQKNILRETHQDLYDQGSK